MKPFKNWHFFLNLLHRAHHDSFRDNAIHSSNSTKVMLSFALDSWSTGWNKIWLYKTRNKMSGSIESNQSFDNTETFAKATGKKRKEITLKVIWQVEFLLELKTRVRSIVNHCESVGRKRNMTCGRTIRLCILRLSHIYVLARFSSLSFLRFPYISGIV